MFAQQGDRFRPPRGPLSGGSLRRRKNGTLIVGDIDTSCSVYFVCSCPLVRSHKSSLEPQRNMGFAGGTLEFAQFAPDFAESYSASDLVAYIPVSIPFNVACRNPPRRFATSSNP